MKEEKGEAEERSAGLWPSDYFSFQQSLCKGGDCHRVTAIQYRNFLQLGNQWHSNSSVRADLRAST